MFEDLAATSGMRFLLAGAAVAAGLVILAVVLRFLKNRPSSPFVRGGKNRQPRLAVLDAAAVDTRRRLVLVRRDEVEHLIMIGGPTDIVIESRIVGAQPVAAAAPSASSAPQPSLTPAQDRRRPVESPAAPMAVPASQPAAEPVARAVPVERRAEMRPTPSPAPPPAAAPLSPVQPPVASTPATPPISSMGQALYGDQEPAAPVRGAQARPQPTPAARPADRPAAPRAEPARPMAAAPGRSPEDILDAARNRVLNTPPSAPQPATALASPPEAARRTDAGDFERLLDAEISGDLSRLTATPTSRPTTGAPPRAEPTLEEEMNRMLGEMGQRRP